MDGGFRWLTVGPKTQPQLEIVLMAPTPGPILDEEAAQAVRLLLAKGVQVAGAPQDRFYGTEAIMRDGLGNWFSMCQRKPGFGPEQ